MRSCIETILPDTNTSIPISFFFLQQHGLMVIVDAIFIPFALVLLLTWVRSGTMRRNLRAGAMMKARITITKQFLLLLVDFAILPLAVFLLASWVVCLFIIPKRFLRWSRALTSPKNDPERVPNHAQIVLLQQAAGCVVDLLTFPMLFLQIVTMYRAAPWCRVWLRKPLETDNEDYTGTGVDAAGATGTAGMARTAGTAGAAAAAAGKEWVCATCTLVNHADADACSACSSPISRPPLVSRDGVEEKGADGGVEQESNRTGNSGRQVSTSETSLEIELDTEHLPQSPPIPGDSGDGKESRDLSLDNNPSSSTTSPSPCAMGARGNHKGGEGGGEGGDTMAVTVAGGLSLPPRFTNSAFSEELHMTILLQFCLMLVDLVRPSRCTRSC